MKAMWEKNNGIYGKYVVSGSRYTATPFNRFIEGLYKPTDTSRYLYVLWKNIKSDVLTPTNRYTVHWVLDTSYMTRTQVELAQKYNAWNPDAASTDVAKEKCCFSSGDF